LYLHVVTLIFIQPALSVVPDAAQLAVAAHPCPVACVCVWVVRRLSVLPWNTAAGYELSCLDLKPPGPQQMAGPSQVRRARKGIECQARARRPWGGGIARNTGRHGSTSKSSVALEGGGRIKSLGLAAFALLS